LTLEGKSNRNAVVIPGVMYGPQAGLLAYVSETAARRDAVLELISWTPPRDRLLEKGPSRVYEQVSAGPPPGTQSGPVVVSIPEGKRPEPALACSP
jgi:hypothetical protein